MATITYKCPNCDGGLIFDPDSQKFKCEYCLSQYTEEELELAAEAGSDGARPEEAASGSLKGCVVYSCPSCGAEVVTDETTAATFCYYCHNPVVLSGRLEGGFEPDYVIPFEYDREKAVEALKEWIRKKKYVPKSFFSDEQLDKMSGIYFPYWFYSCSVDGEMVADATTIRMWTSGDIRYTETKKYSVERSGLMEVKNMTRNALHKANKELVDGVLPFQMEGIREFHMGYLSGFQAEKRDLEKEKFEAEVKQEVREFAVEKLKASVPGYDTISVKKHSENVSGDQWKYGLMPVWVMTYIDKQKDKVYYFALNGQTGKICGELPVDMGRLCILFATVFFPVFLVLLLGGYLI